MSIFGRPIRVSTPQIPVPSLDDVTLRQMMEECLLKAEEARVGALNRAEQLKELFRERERRAGRTHNPRVLEIYADGEKNKDGEWKRFVADNNWYMTRALTYAEVLRTRASVRESINSTVPIPRSGVE